MTTEQPLALKLADRLDNPPGAPLFMDCTAELRRLSAVEAENEVLHAALAELRWVRQFIHKHEDGGIVIRGADGNDIAVWLDRVDTAIAKIEGAKT